MSSEKEVKLEEEADKLTTSDSESSSSESQNQSSKVTIRKKEKPKMTSSITLSVLTKFIKPYNGDRELLPAFLTNCENAFSLASTDQQNVLCKYIVSQLEGKAQLACCLKKFSTWPEIKQFLKATFGEKKHSTHLLVDLQNCKQLPTEDVTQYSLRVESCLTRLQSDIHYSCDDDKELIGRLAAMEDLALNTFLLGINSNYSHIVRCRNPKTLSDAITHAIEEEKLYKLSRLAQRQNKQCSICQKSGHLASDCYKNKTKTSSPNFHHVNSNPHVAHGNNQNSRFSSNKTCAYCKKPGHLIGECRKLKFKNNQNAADSHDAASPSAGAFHNNAANNSRSNVHVVSVSSDDQVDLN